MLPWKRLPLLVAIILCGWPHDVGRAGDINREGITIGLTPAGTYSPDLDVPMRSSGSPDWGDVGRDRALQFRYELFGVLPHGSCDAERKLVSQLRFSDALARIDAPAAATFTSFGASRDAAYAHLPLLPFRSMFDCRHGRYWSHSAGNPGGVMTGITVSRSNP